MPHWIARPRSLRHRLLLLTLTIAGLTLVASGVMLSALFQAHVQQQLIDRMSADLDQVMAVLEADAQGLPAVDDTRLYDPRWQRPHSGLYWQVDGAGAQGSIGLLRSRSLWDAQLAAPHDQPATGELHVHDARSAQGEPLLLVERTLRADGARQPWRVMVATSTAPLEQAAAHFDAVLSGALLVLLMLLTGGALLQITIGLAPLNALRQSLQDMRDGKTSRLQGQYPSEIQPLVDDLNSLLDRHAGVLQRARAQAGNLAHALKTPLAILSQGAAQAQASVPARDALPALVVDQVQLAQRHVDWHLARSRAAAAQGGMGLSTPLRPAIEGLLRVMQKVHAQRQLSFHTDADDQLAFSGEAQDLQEMLGNLLDNACKAARSQVRIGVTSEGQQLQIAVDDDGPGIPASLRAQAMQRGGRLDESKPGSGLGLAIVDELASLYGGSVQLRESPLGGVSALLVLPRSSGVHGQTQPAP